MEDRLSRTRLLLGDHDLDKLRKSTVMVVGCGAVGSFAIEALARAGIGKLILVDFDTVKISNINRQIFALHSTLGLEKTEAAANRLKDIAPDMTVEIIKTLVNADTVADVLNRPVDFVIDAIDSLNPKTILIETLIKRGIGFISSMGAALKTDPSKISIVPMKKTMHCPLAFFVRKRLRKRGVDMSFPVVYSCEDVSQKEHLEVPQDIDQPTGRIRLNMGSLPTITGIFGLMCANYAITYLREHKE